MAVDGSGDCMIDGDFEGTRTDANNTINFISGWSDFFLKYAISLCSLDNLDVREQEVKRYLNAVQDTIQIKGLKGNF